MSNSHKASAMPSQISQKNPLSSTAVNNPNINLMGQTVFNTVYQDPNKNLASTVQSMQGKGPNSIKSQASKVNSQVNNNISNTINTANPASRTSNTPNRISSNEASKNISKTQVSHQNGKNSKFSHSIVNDGKTLSNIDLNNETQSNPASQRGSKIAKTVMNNNPQAQSFQVSKQGSPSQSLPNQNMPTISQQARAFPGVLSAVNLPPNSQLQIRNTQQQSLKSNIQSQNQSIPQNIQSQKKML